MEIVKHYRNNNALRASFNQLAGRTFGIDFEPWYQRGFWTDRYDPWSVVENGQVIANVSVNHMDMHFLGKAHRLIQLGTVMTDPAYRNRGLIRLLMEEIQRDFADAEGMLLFANDTVLDFYPKFGFRRGKEYSYAKAFSGTGAGTAKKVSMEDPENWTKLRRAMEHNAFGSGCRMEHNPGLPLFYILAEYADCVYHCPSLDAWVIAERLGQTLHILDIYASRPVDICAVVSAFGGGFSRVCLGFAPEESEGWEREPLQEENSTLFVSGAVFADFEANALRIPILGRA